MGYINRVLVFLILSILCSDVELKAQEIAKGYYHKVWNTEDGLPVNQVTDFIINDKGYIWLTTFNGLVRFDGLVRYNPPLFRVFNKNNTPELITNGFVRIKKGEDDSFNLHTVSVNGTNNLISYADNAFKKYGVAEGLKDGLDFDTDTLGVSYLLSNESLFKFSNDTIIVLYKDIYRKLGSSSGIRSKILVSINENEHWFYNAETLELYHIHNGKVLIFGKENGLAIDKVNAIREGENGSLWVLGEGILYHISGEIHDIKSYEIGDDFSASTLGTVINEEGSKDIFHLGSSGGKILLFQKNKFRYIESQKDIHRSTKEFEVEGWFVINGGHIYHNEKLVYKQDSFDGTLFDYSFKTDPSGNLWFAQINGLHYIKKNSFESLSDKDFGINPNFYPIMEDHDNVIWIAPLNTGRIQRISNENIEPFEALLSELRNQRVYSLMEDKNNNVWIGHTGGLIKWDRLSMPKNISKDGNMSLVKGLFEDSKGRIWIGDRGNVHQMIAEEEIKTYSNPKGYSSAFSTLIYEDRIGKIWFGTTGNGLWYYDEDLDEIVSFEHNDQLSNNIIRSMYQDKDGVYWIGTTEDGLNRFEYVKTNEPPKFTYYNPQNGLFGLVIHSILEDANERLWMSCNKGVFWVSKKELNAVADGELERIHSMIYDKSDGLPGNEANGGMQSTAIKASDGRFWFSMVEGLAVIDPNEIKATDKNIESWVYEILSDDKTYQRIGNNEKLKLGKDERNLEIRFAAFMEGNKPENTRFRFKMTGYEDEWRFPGYRQEAFYTGLPPGEYTFNLEAVSLGGMWSPSKDPVLISIAPFFYETDLFYFLIFLLVAGTGFVAYRRRLQIMKNREIELNYLVDQQTVQLKDQAERLLKLDDAKSTFFANVSHEFRTPLSLTIAPLEDLKKRALEASNKDNVVKIDMALRNSKRLLKLVNQILDISKLESGSVDVEIRMVNISEVIKQLCLAFTGLAERKRINLLYESLLDPVWIYVDVDMIEKVFINLLANAFKFTPDGGSIHVEMKEQNEVIEISVRDSGYGISEQDIDHVFDRFYQTNESKKGNEAGTGIGLALTKELVDLHKGTIKAESTAGEGATFTVILKKGKAHFPEDQVLDTEYIIPTEDRFTEEGKVVAENNEMVNTQEIENTTLLIIDDNEDIRNYLSGHLSKRYRILTAENGAEGLEIANKELPDIVICDVMMPKMDGFTFCRELKSSEETSFIPVILLTAKALQTDKLEGLGMGADDYLVKPFDIEEVKLRTHNIIESRKTLKDRFSTTGYSILVTDSKVSSEDEIFLEKITQSLEQGFSDENYSVEQLSRDVAMTRGTLYKKLKAISGKTPTDVIREFRLIKSKQLLSQKAGSVSEIAYSSGFKSVSVFSTAFKNEFGQSPSEFMTS
jgi:signal transduction histidine kinase/DNA-binding response OmpR family regulator/ligand-binding sensor domain-containing protein